MANEKTVQEKPEHIKALEADFEQWVKYYFPNECPCKPASFHVAATQRIINAPHWIEVRLWSRELALTTRTIQEVRYLVLTGRKKNVMISSHTASAARQVMTQIDMMYKNWRVIEDYADVLRSVEMSAGGVGQKMCGARSGERCDLMVFIEIDTDDNCQSIAQVEKNWRWFERDILPAGALDKLLILWCGQQRAKDSCITRAAANADFVEVINITDQEGLSVWPERNSDENIQRLFSTMSERTIQREFYNNPI